MSGRELPTHSVGLAKALLGVAAAQRLAPGIGHLRFLASALGLAVPGVVTAICRLWSMELRRSSRGFQRLCDEQREGEQAGTDRA